MSVNQPCRPCVIIYSTPGNVDIQPLSCCFGPGVPRDLLGVCNDRDPRDHRVYWKEGSRDGSTGGSAEGSSHDERRRIQDGTRRTLHRGRESLVPGHQQKALRAPQPPGRTQRTHSAHTSSPKQAVRCPSLRLGEGRDPGSFGGLGGISRPCRYSGSVLITRRHSACEAAPVADRAFGAVRRAHAARTRGRDSVLVRVATGTVDTGSGMSARASRMRSSRALSSR